MNFLYASVCDQSCWEDLVLYDSEEEAIKASIENPNIRIEKFIRNDKKFVPTYDYYKNGNLILTDLASLSDPPEINTTILQKVDESDIASSAKPENNYNPKQCSKINNAVKAENYNNNQLQCDMVPQRIKRQTNDLPLKLGDKYYEIDKEYLLAGSGKVPDHIINVYALMDSIKNEKIDELGISEKHPGYLFQIKKHEGSNFPMASIYNLKIVKNYSFSYDKIQIY